MDSKTVYVISPPRVRSVCVTRVLEQTGLFTIYHEPYCPIFQARKYPDATASWTSGKQFNSHEQIQGALTSCGKPYILIKDMAFAVYDEFMSHEEIFSKPQTKFIFLIRDPCQVLHSIYERIGDTILHTADSLSEICGYRQIWEMYNKLTHGRVCIVNMDCPTRGIARVLEFLNIPFKKEYLTWDKCETREKLQEKINAWHDYMNVDTFKHWHGEAFSSEGFYPALQNQRTPEFLSIPEAERTRYVLSYQQCLMHFHLLTKENRFIDPKIDKFGTAMTESKNISEEKSCGPTQIVCCAQVTTRSSPPGIINLVYYSENGQQWVKRVEILPRENFPLKHITENLPNNFPFDKPIKSPGHPFSHLEGCQIVEIFECVTKDPGHIVLNRDDRYNRVYGCMHQAVIIDSTGNTRIALLGPEEIEFIQKSNCSHDCEAHPTENVGEV